MFIQRALQKVVTDTSKAFPVILVTGARQIGKTTLLEKTAEKNRGYVSLDDPLARQLARNEPSLFLQRYEPPVIIDEIQYAPELLPYIKIYVDKTKENGQFWLTGSQMFQTMLGVSESLAGRVGIIPMHGISNAELQGIPNEEYTTDPQRLLQRVKTTPRMTLPEVYHRIFKGSMPSIYKENQNTERYYASYVDTYINRDIRDLSQVADEMQFQKFLIACAARTGQMLNYTEIARDVGITSPTAKKWVSLLVSSGIVVLIEPYYHNLLKRIVKSPKMYFMDTGLCAYLTRWTSSEALEVSAMSGAFFETYVVSEIIKSYLNQGKRPPLYYYRDSDQKEIDLIIEQDGTLYPIEIKKTSHPGKEAGRHFSVLNKLQCRRGPGNIICMTDDLTPLSQDLWAVPVWMI